MDTHKRKIHWIHRKWFSSWEVLKEPRIWWGPDDLRQRAAHSGTNSGLWIQECAKLVEEWAGMELRKHRVWERDSVGCHPTFSVLFSALTECHCRQGRSLVSNSSWVVGKCIALGEEKVTLTALSHPAQHLRKSSYPIPELWTGRVNLATRSQLLPSRIRCGKPQMSSKNFS